MHRPAANIVLVLAVLTGSAGCKHDADKAPAVASSRAINARRVMVIGASMSAGFAGSRLDKLLDKAIGIAHETRASTSVLFFADAIGTGKRQVAAARAFHPTLTVALDFLFWYAYAAAPAAERMRRLDVGLAALQTLPGHVVVGDLADMSGADPNMLPPAKVPPADQLAALNRRIHAWAKTRPRLHVIPFSIWAAPLRGRGTIAVAPNKPPVPARSLLAPDRLHPNADGMRYIVRRLVENLREAFPETPKNALGSTL